MTKTRVDDMLIEMITPKVKEIIKKFNFHQKLENSDVQLLLLYAIQSKFDDRFDLGILKQDS